MTFTACILVAGDPAWTGQITATDQAAAEAYVDWLARIRGLRGDVTTTVEPA